MAGELASALAIALSRQGITLFAANHQITHWVNGLHVMIDPLFLVASEHVLSSVATLILHGYAWVTPRFPKLSSMPAG